MSDELQGYTDVLMGREDTPIPNGVASLYEYANAVYSRGMELTAMIQKAEREGRVAKNSNAYKFRTGELRTFVEMASKAADLGSRRVTVAKMEYDQTHSFTD